MKRVNIMGVPFLHIDQKGFVELLAGRAERKEKTFVITANPEIVMQANENPQLMEYVQQATYVCADGIGVVKAASILGSSLPGRVTGYDSMMALLERGKTKKYKMYLLGAQKTTVEKAVANINRDYPGVEIVGYRDGFFDWNDPAVAEEIVAAKPDFVFLALGVPRQEKWIAEHLHMFEHGVFVGVGGSFDVIAGTVERAPEFWQKINLEWLYRLLKQPSRWKRMLALPKFALKVFGMRLRGQGVSK